MSIEALMWAKRQRLKPLGGTVAHRAILMVLADYADESRECYPGQELIAWETEQSVRTVRRHLGDLEAWALIRREARFRTDDRSGRNVRTSDRYVLALDLELTDGPEPSTGQSDRRTGMTGGQVDLRPNVAVVPDNTPVVIPDTRDRGTDRGTDSKEPSGRSFAHAKTATMRTTVPEPFVVTDDMREWARRSHPLVTDLDATTRDFVDYHASKRTLYTDWTRTWQTWVRKAEGYMKRQVSTRHVDDGQEALRREQAAMFEGTG